MLRVKFFVLIVLFFPIPLISAQEEHLIILHAGSLAKPFRELEAIFESENPSLDVIREVSGSKLAIRKVLELKKEADIIAVSDSYLIQEFLYPNHASWTINFAKNSMVIAFTDRSKYSKEINQKNWYRILLRNNLEVGHSDPLLDPCGYRALLVIKLAEEYYRTPGLYNKFISKIPKKNIRPKETELVALAEAGELDYHFNYKSVAEQHHLRYIELPDEINLSSVKFRENYRRANIEIKDRDKRIILRGEPILNGITILKGSKNPDYAEKFLLLLLSQKGREILRKNHLEPLEPPEVDGEKEVPDGILRKLHENQ